MSEMVLVYNQRARETSKGPQLTGSVASSVPIGDARRWSFPSALFFFFRQATHKATSFDERLSDAPYFADKHGHWMYRYKAIRKTMLCTKSEKRRSMPLPSCRMPGP
jgi:hypothetical protein